MSSRSLPLNLHHPSDQYDDIARISGPEPGAGRSRRAPAPWNRHRESARCAGRMVLAIRQARARLPSVDITAPGTEFSRPETRLRIRHIPPAGDRLAKITRRIGRANAAFSRKVSVIRDLGDCVVVLRGLELRARHAVLSNRSLRGRTAAVHPQSRHPADGLDVHLVPTSDRAFSSCRRLP